MLIRWFALPIAALLTASSLAAPGSGLHEKVSIEYAPAKIRDALADIGRKTGVRITYTADTLKGVKPVTLKIEGKTAGRILNDVLRRRGLKLRFDGANQVTVVRHNWYTPLTKNEAVYEFVRKPTVRKVGGDSFEITLETKGFCDCTVAIEDTDGKIVRHLARSARPRTLRPVCAARAFHRRVATRRRPGAASGPPRCAGTARPAPPVAPRKVLQSNRMTMGG